MFPAGSEENTIMRARSGERAVIRDRHAQERERERERERGGGGEKEEAECGS
jgi:hypothetical protein